jgi:hypothetical protein
MAFPHKVETMKRYLIFCAISLGAIGLGVGVAATNAATYNMAQLPAAAPVLPKALNSVVVHFPRLPISNYNFTYTYNVNRSTKTTYPEIGALQWLVQGPTATEVSTLNLKAVVPTTLGTCLGQPLPAGAVNAGKFMYKRQISGTDVAYKIRFCQPTNPGGIGDDARLRSAITETLWANINYVAGVNNISQIDISYSNGQCITNGSGSPCWP